VIETNLFGAIHAARAVLPVFGRQRSRVLINVGSIVFRRLYAAVGFGRLVAPSRLLGPGGVLDVAYRAFAGQPPAPSCAVHSRA
jgi:NAD(P)-dependent dehydrogenase (short-subunit alcohol dehydrogenase family)